MTSQENNNIKSEFSKMHSMISQVNSSVAESGISINQNIQKLNDVSMEMSKEVQSPRMSIDKQSI